MTDLSSRDLVAAVSGADRRTILHIFQHALFHNLTWREVSGLFRTTGPAKDSGKAIRRVGQTPGLMKQSHGKDRTVSKATDLGRLLVSEGCTPGDVGLLLDAAAPGLERPDLVIAIDHNDARIYRLGPADGNLAAAPTEAQHQLCHVARGPHEPDCNETDVTTDIRFLGRIATAAAGGERILLIGHGKGQANEADHLSRYLRTYHGDVHARIVDEIVADLPHLALPERLALGRHAFSAAARRGWTATQSQAVGSHAA